jgi:hypothetical protein
MMERHTAIGRNSRKLPLNLNGRLPFSAPRNWTVIDMLGPTRQFSIRSYPPFATIPAHRLSGPGTTESRQFLRSLMTNRVCSQESGKRSQGREDSFLPRAMKTNNVSMPARADYGPGCKISQRSKQGYHARLAALRKSIDEGDAGGIAKGNVFDRVRNHPKLSRQSR